jgi:hypothetical protein
VSSQLERRYRRVLRLLPVGYRQRWQEDMVSAFLERAEARSPGAAVSDRPPWAERLSVAALAVRLRLTGSYATPRGRVWYHAVHGLALLVLLYQATAATIQTAFTVRVLVESTMDLGGYPEPLYLQFFLWSRIFSVFWVAALLCFVLGRLVVARVVVVLALTATVAVTVATYVIHGSPASQGIPFGLPDLSRWGWLVVSVTVVLLAPPGIRIARRVWLGAYLGGAVVLVCADQLEAVRSWPWIRFVSLTYATSAALIIAMAVTVIRFRSGGQRSPHRLLYLAAFAGSVGGVQLVTVLARQVPPMDFVTYAGLTVLLDVISIGLAVVCAAIGLLAERRLPAAPVPT